MKKIFIFFILILSSIFFLVGCEEILTISNDFINDTGTNSFIPQDIKTNSEEAVESANNSETITETEYAEETEISDTFSEEPTESESEININTDTDVITVDENGEYTDKERVALYIHTYSRLPGNYITKKEAQAMGWNSKDNTMAEVLPGKSIGGDNFGNYEGSLPKKQGRTYKECDIDYEKGGRNAKRIVYSNDGLIFYTEDHYNSFEQLY